MSRGCVPTLERYKCEWLREQRAAINKWSHRHHLLMAMVGKQEPYDARVSRTDPWEPWGRSFPGLSGGDLLVALATIIDRLLHHSQGVTIRSDRYRLMEKRRSGLFRPPAGGTARIAPPVGTTDNQQRKRSQKPCASTSSAADQAKAKQYQEKPPIRRQVWHSFQCRLTQAPLPAVSTQLSGVEPSGLQHQRELVSSDPALLVFPRCRHHFPLQSPT